MEKKIKVASAGDILSAKNLIVTVPAPEIGPDVIIRVKCPDAEQLDELDAADFSGGSRRRKAGYLVRWAISCVVDENDQKILTPDKAKEVGKKSGKLLERIFSAAVNGPDISDMAVEAEVKN